VNFKQCKRDYYKLKKVSCKILYRSLAVSCKRQGFFLVSTAAAVSQMKAALEWITSALAPSNPKLSTSALDDPFYQPAERVTMSDSAISASKSGESDLAVSFLQQIIGATSDNGASGGGVPDTTNPLLDTREEEREHKLYQLIYNGLYAQSPYVRKSMLATNDMILSSERDVNGFLVRQVYWMGEQHMYALIFMSCRSERGYGFYDKPYYKSKMGGMQMIGIPSDSIMAIIDEIWAQLIHRGYKVYGEDVKEALVESALNSDAVTTPTDPGAVIFDSQEPDTEVDETEKSRLARRREPETFKNK
jgi:hypothetical protein